MERLTHQNDYLSKQSSISLKTYFQSWDKKSAIIEVSLYDRQVQLSTLTVTICLLIRFLMVSLVSIIQFKRRSRQPSTDVPKRLQAKLT